MRSTAQTFFCHKGLSACPKPWKSRFCDFRNFGPTLMMPKLFPQKSYGKLWNSSTQRKISMPSTRGWQILNRFFWDFGRWRPKTNTKLRNSWLALAGRFAQDQGVARKYYLYHTVSTSHISLKHCAQHSANVDFSATRSSLRAPNHDFHDFRNFRNFDLDRKCPWCNLHVKWIADSNPPRFETHSRLKTFKNPRKLQICQKSWLFAPKRDLAPA